MPDIPEQGNCPTAKPRGRYDRAGFYWSRRAQTYPDGAHHIEDGELHYRCASCDEDSVVTDFFAQAALPGNEIRRVQLVADCKKCGKPTLIIVDGEYSCSQIRTYAEEPEKADDAKSA